MNGTIAIDIYGPTIQIPNRSITDYNVSISNGISNHECIWHVLFIAGFLWGKFRNSSIKLEQKILRVFTLTLPTYLLNYLLFVLLKGSDPTCFTPPSTLVSVIFWLNLIFKLVFDCLIMPKNNRYEYTFLPHYVQH